MKNQRSSWKHGESTYTLSEGGEPFGRSLKAQSLKTVRVITDDAEISLGYLLRNDENNQIRVGHCVGFLRDLFQFSRKQIWRVDAVCRARIKEMVVLG